MPVLAITSALLALETCVGERAPNQGVPWVEYDSAGIVVVQNEDRPDLDGAGFTLGTEPLVSIGTLDGAPEYQLFRVTGGTILEDGRIVVVNSGSHEIRLYAMGGEYLHSFGGEGEGPGEFGRPVLLGPLSRDSLLIYDTDLRRASVPYSALEVDALGYLWVQDYAGPRVRDPRWTIFDGQGHIAGSISTPDRMQILEIGEDYVLGRLSDEFDVEYIQIYDLTRPSDR